MTVQIDSTAEIDAVRLKTEGAHPAAPSSGHVLLYYVTGTASPGLYTELSNGQKVGPFITGSASSGAGALVFLGSQTASNSASLSFNSLISATYDKYVLEIVDMIAQTNNVDLNMQYSADNGSSYETGNNYYCGLLNVYNGGSTGGGGGNPTSAFQLALGVVNTVSRPINGTVYLQNFPSTALSKNIYGQVSYTNQTNVAAAAVQGLLLVPGTAYNAFKLFFSSGNIVSGVARLYGIANS